MSEVLQHARTHLRSGVYLPNVSVSTSERVLVVARGVKDAQLNALAETIADLQLLRANFRPLFLVGQIDTVPLSRFKFQFETVMNESMLALIHPDMDVDAYWRQRIFEMHQVYAPHRTVRVLKDMPVEAWMFP